ncbi:MAG: hypothetical protein JXX29_14385 [Deltaproteobacteria bacterium]|nr:hypothetical protein [Deltaproteobacteria bacterium]MBN2672867.1 hypothetical protein [Deltaproteobacteria bacterium]
MKKFFPSSCILWYFNKSPVIGLSVTHRKVSGTLKPKLMKQVYIYMFYQKGNE